MAAASLRREVVVSLFAVMLATLGLLSAVLGGLAAQSVQRHALDRLAQDARELERLGAGGSGRLVDLAVLARARRGPARWHVLDEGGRLLGAGPGRVPAPPELAGFARALERGAFASGGLPGRELALARPVASALGERGVLVGRVPHEALLAELAPLLRSGAWVLAMGALCFVGFGAHLLGRRVVDPLRALIRATDRVARGDLSARVETHGAGEIAELAGRFNQMAGALAAERDALWRARDSLERSRSLAAVGQLAAGVAHEVGNPVAAILGFAEAIERDRALPAASRSRDAAARIREEALRVRLLVRELLDVARPCALEPEPVDLPSWVESLAARLRVQPRFAHVRIRVDCTGGLAPLRTDRRRAEQILLNFADNAAHALAGRGGTIELRAAPARAGAARRRDDPAPDPGTHDAVALSVLDDGPGIDAETLPQVFDPFFTTKPPGEGTGLGLWNAHRLAEQLGARIEVESAPGRTRFSLVVPRADTPGTDGATPDPDRR